MKLLRASALVVLLVITAAATATADSGDWKWDPHAEAELDTFAYPQNEVGNTNSFLEKGRISLPSTLRYRRAFKLKLDPVAQADPLDNSVSERYWVDLPEGYAQWQSGSTTLQLGYNVFTWGVTDGFNPLDVVNARRYQDPLRSEKLGAPSIAAKEVFGKVSFEALYIPWQRKSVLPGENSRWLPRDQFKTRSFGDGVNEATLVLPAVARYSYEQDTELNRALYNNFGARIQATGILPGLDASLVGFEGASPTPGMAVDITATSTSFNPFILQVAPAIGLRPAYYRERVYGGSLVYAGLGSIFRFETAITRVISKRIDLPGSAEEYVLGAEHSYPLGTDSLTLLLQLTYAHHTDTEDSSPGSLGRMFDRGVILGARYPFSEKLTTLLSAVADTQYHGELVHLEGSYALTDNFKATLALEGLWGPPLSPIGTYRRNDRAIAGLKAAL